MRRALRGVSGTKRYWQERGRQVEREDAASNFISVTRGSDGETAEREHAPARTPALSTSPPPCCTTTPPDDDDDDFDLRRLRNDIPIPSAPRVKW